MRHRIACVVVATERRRKLVEHRVLPSIAGQDFDDVIVVGDWEQHVDYHTARYLYVAPMLSNTLDALVRRDCGTAACTADILIYLCDDHILGPEFGAGVRAIADDPSWDVVVPHRDTVLPNGTRIALNMGAAEAYCGGHGGIFRRWVVMHRPWTAQRHDRLWDVYASHQQQREGARFVWHPRTDLTITDIEPGAKPWE